MAFRDGRLRGRLHPSGPERCEGAEGTGFFAAKRARGAPRGGGKSSARGLRAAPALIGKPPCNRERGSCVDELMNRGLITDIGGQRAEARKRKRVDCQRCRLGESLIGAALLYGDGAITPATSVLSAVEGLKLDAPQFTPLIVPITVVILTVLFFIQWKGTTFIGRIFGPVMLVWF